MSSAGKKKMLSEARTSTAAALLDPWRWVTAPAEDPWSLVTVPPGDPWCWVTAPAEDPWHCRDNEVSQFLAHIIFFPLF